MASKKIVLDAGHGLYTAGKRTPDDVREWTLNNAVCNYIAEYLKDYDVQITRTDDTTGKTDVALKTRVAKINSINPNIFVSIHHNAYNGKWNDVTGVEVYSHAQGTTADRNLSQLLVPKISKETGLKNRGAKTMQLAVLGCKSSIPAVLCEGGFMDSRIDNPVITSEKGQRAYAKAVADGIIEYINPTKIERVKTTAINPIKIKLKNNCNLYGIETGKVVKSYAAGTIIENIVAMAEYKGSKYYMTEYSYKNKVYNGFNINDCEEYIEPVEVKPIEQPQQSTEQPQQPVEKPVEEKQKNSLAEIIMKIVEFIISLFKK